MRAPPPIIALAEHCLRTVIFTLVRMAALLGVPDPRRAGLACPFLGADHARAPLFGPGRVDSKQNSFLLHGYPVVYYPPATCSLGDCLIPKVLRVSFCSYVCDTLILGTLVHLDAKGVIGCIIIKQYTTLAVALHTRHWESRRSPLEGGEGGGGIRPVGRSGAGGRGGGKCEGIQSPIIPLPL